MTYYIMIQYFLNHESCLGPTTTSSAFPGKNDMNKTTVTRVGGPSQ